MTLNADKTHKISNKLRLWEDSNAKENIAPLAPQQIDSYFNLEKLCSMRVLLNQKGDKLDKEVSEKEVLLNFNGAVELKICDDLEFNKSGINNLLNPAQFYESFYLKIKANMQNAHAKPYRSYLESLEKFKKDEFIPIKTFLKEIDDETKYLNNEYFKVNTLIKQLHNDCELIKIEQEQYTRFMDQINTTLGVFDRIDNNQERLMENNGLPLGQESCIHMLKQIYKDMNFLRNKPTYKDAPLYLAKCWNHTQKLLTTTKNHIFKILDQAFKYADPSNVNDIVGNNLGTAYNYDSQKPTFGDTFDSDDSYTRLYGKFRAIVCRAKNLVAYLEEHSTDKGAILKGRDRESFDPQRINSPGGGPSLRSILPTLGDQLDERKEALSVLNECLSHYVVKRERLVLPMIKNTLEDLLAKHPRDHCHLFRSATSFFSNLCSDEINLYNQLFTVTTPALKYYLENVCAILSDCLRSRILHINHLETLSELCSVLKFEVTQQTEPGAEIVPGGVIPDQLFTETVNRLLGDVRERIVYRTHVYVETDIKGYQPSPGDLAYPQKLKMIKEIADTLNIERSGSIASSRNSFVNGDYANTNGRSRTSSFDIHDGTSSSATLHDEDSMSETESLHSTLTLNSKSNFYNTRQGGTRYGRRPSTASSCVSSTSSIGNYSRRTTGSSSKSEYPNSPSELYGLWFPTVRRTIVCLSKLNRCLDKSVFQSLSQDVLSACLDSLTKAASAIRSKSTSVDAHLFLIKHLLIVREQISPFQSKFAHKEISLDFSNFKDAALKMFHQKYAFLSFSKNNAFLEFVINGAPGIHEVYLDSRKTVDDTLKLACQKFVKESIQSMTGELDAYIDQIKPLLLRDHDKTSNGSRDESPTIGSKQGDKGTPDVDVSVATVAEKVQNYYRHLKETTALIRGRLSLYLTNSDTEYILFRPLRLNAQKSFTTLRDLLQHHYSEEDQLLIACPTFEQVSQMVSESIEEPTNMAVHVTTP